MKRTTSFNHWPFVFLLTLLTAFHLSSFQDIPFHPDESTYLYFSSDFEKLLTDPLSLAWTPDLQKTPELDVRAGNAPLARYIVGLGRSGAGLQPLPADWDWGKTWEYNDDAGALPDARLLWFARLTNTLLLPFSLTFIYLTGNRVGGHMNGLLAAFLLGTNALVLVHSRRAMQEAILLLGIIMTIWGMMRGNKRPWLTGLSMGLAFNGKHSAAALFPAALLAVVWMPRASTWTPRTIARNIILFASVFLFLTIIFNPFLWRYPLQAGQTIWQGRINVLRGQVADTTILAPDQVLHTPGQRAAVNLANLYVVPPSFAEVSQYLHKTALIEEVYLALPGHLLFRGLPGGGSLLLLTVFGLIAGILHLRLRLFEQRRMIILLLIATLLQWMALIIAIPLPWQRWVIPLVPFTTLWIAYGLTQILRAGQAALAER